MSPESTSKPAVPPIPKSPLPSSPSSPPSASTPASDTGEAQSKSPTSAGPAAPRTLSAAQRAKERSIAHHRKWKRIEWAWTLIPAALLVVLAGLTAGLLYNLDSGPTAYGATANWHVNITGAQWYWSYSYTDPYAAAVFTSLNITNESSILYVPQNAVVELNVTSIDVVHDWNVVQLGVRIDAIPGRINHAWLTIPAGAAPGTSYLVQCGEFCGQGHYSMLSRVVVVKSNGLLPPS